MRNKLFGGLADKRKESDFDKKELAKGIRTEMEHTDDPQIAKEIAMDHLTEDPKYYTKLAKMESSKNNPSESLQARLNAIFEAKSEDGVKVVKYKSVVAVVEYRNRWLLGLSLATDDRHYKWCFPGGRIESSESPEDAAERECKEESNVTANAKGKARPLKGKPDVAFVHCKAEYIKRMEPNSEFAAFGFFDRKEMKSLVLYKNVYDLIDECD